MQVSSGIGTPTPPWSECVGSSTDLFSRIGVVLQHLGDEKDGAALVIRHVLQGHVQDPLRQGLLLVLHVKNRFRSYFNIQKFSD